MTTQDTTLDTTLDPTDPFELAMATLEAAGLRFVVVDEGSLAGDRLAA
ncbi:MAG: hypothetical protein ACLGHX_06740 [Acidimicrobiia bacterium]